MTNALKHLLFIDIETVALTPTFELLPERLKPLWMHKARYIMDADISPEQSYFERAAIYAEFGKVIVIGLGFFFYNESNELCLKVKSICGHDEKELLTEFKMLIESKFESPTLKLCAHNGREFDFPYLCRRMLVHGIALPDILKISDKKPWEIRHLDTLEMWKFGDKKSYTSLELLAATLDVPTSKEGIDGSKVNETYYIKNDLEEISKYCKRDVAVTARIFLKLNCLPAIKDSNLFYI